MNNLTKEQLSFSISYEDKFTAISPTLSKGRCRIFYKFGNRNGTYITEEFAEKLVSSLPYTPVKGIYSEEEKDYNDHGDERDKGRIYGVVPENPNFSWERHLDKDGVEREYGCCDVFLFTALYKEAKDIVTKSQSMELYSETIDGDWEDINGQRYFVFKDGQFLGLQVLGRKVEPCFEGAAFYSLYEDFKALLNEIQQYTLKNVEGEEKMNKTTSESTEVEKVKEIEETSEKDIYTIEKSSIEYSVLMKVKEINNDTFDGAIETLNEFSSLKEKSVADAQKIVEQKNLIDTLTTERDKIQLAYTNLQNEKKSIDDELTSLREFKANIDKQQKEEILDSYSVRLDEATISSYRDKLNEYTKDSLKKELAYTLVEKDPAILSKGESHSYIPKDTPVTGIEAILSKYKK